MRSGKIPAVRLCVAILLFVLTGSLASCSVHGCGGDATSVSSVETDEESAAESDPSESSEIEGSSEDVSEAVSSKTVSSEKDVESDKNDVSSETEPPRIMSQPKSASVTRNGSVKISVKAKGEGLQYQWYVKTDPQAAYSARKKLTHATETVKHDGKWSVMFCYCIITDKAGHQTASDAVVITLKQSVNLLAVGDSICRGGRNSRKGFVGDLGYPYVNLGLNGATLSTKETTVTTIPDQLAGAADSNPDIIIADGGVNDYIYNVPLGRVPKTPVSDPNELTRDELRTAMGGLQKLFALMRSKFPHARRYFVITHKTTQRIPKTIDGKYVYTDEDRYVDWTVTKNKAGYTQQDLHDAIVACCRVYDVEVIDIYKKSALNTAEKKYCSDTSYFEDASVTNSAAVDIDGVHPLSKGYSEYYIPLIRKQIKIVQQTGEIPLEILLQPTDKTVSLGNPVTLSLKASGTKLSYQWYYKKADQTSFSKWRKSTNDSETVTPNASWNGIQLYCVVTDGHGDTVQSNTITVKVK